MFAIGLCVKRYYVHENCVGKVTCRIRVYVCLQVATDLYGPLMLIFTLIALLLFTMKSSGYSVVSHSFSMITSTVSIYLHTGCSPKSYMVLTLTTHAFVIHVMVTPVCTELTRQPRHRHAV